MPTALEQAMVGARVVSTDGADSNLNILVVRLLVVALDISRDVSTGPGSTPLEIPTSYRLWPNRPSSAETKHGRQSLRCYVCPNALFTADDAPFPVGTVFVVASAPSLWNAEAAGEPTSLFVMEKVAGVSVGDRSAPRRESWRYASYDLAGRPTAAGDRRCGVCRVPLN